MWVIALLALCLAGVCSPAQTQSAALNTSPAMPDAAAGVAPLSTAVIPASCIVINRPALVVPLLWITRLEGAPGAPDGDISSDAATPATPAKAAPAANLLLLAETVPGVVPQQILAQQSLAQQTMVQQTTAPASAAPAQAGSAFKSDKPEIPDSAQGNQRIAEVKVLQNNFSAEFGRGYANVTLPDERQGTNRLHGDVYWFHENSATSANDFFRNAAGKDDAGHEVAPIPVQRRHQYGFRAGGPLLRNKLFYYGTFDQVRDGGWQEVTDDVLLPNERKPDISVRDPADRAWIQSVIDRFPNVEPNNPLAGPRAYSTERRFSYPDYDYSGRADWLPAAGTTLFARYQWMHQVRTGEDIIQGERADQNNHQQDLMFDLTRNLTHTQTGELRFTLARSVTLVDIAAGNGTPVVRFNGTQNPPLIGSAGAFPIHRFDTDWEFAYNHLWMASRKLTLKFGADHLRQSMDDEADNFSRGFWTFSAGNGGNAFSNFLRGFVSTFQRGYGSPQLASTVQEINFYGEADLKLARNFTLTLGFRDEYVGEPQEEHLRVNYNYQDRHNPEPRFGFAWSPGFAHGPLAWITGGPGRSVLRGGAGLFHGRLFGSYFSQSSATLRFNPPNGAFLIVNNVGKVADPTFGFQFTPGPQDHRVNLTRIDPNLRLPYTEQWNLTAERQLPADMVLSLAYVGNHGVALPLYDSLNRAEFPMVAPDSPLVNAMNRGQPMRCVDRNLGNANPAAGCISLTQPRIDDRRPDPSYGAITGIRNGSRSYYHALEAVLQKRFTHGFDFQTGYTFSKSIDTGSESSPLGADPNLVVNPAVNPGGFDLMRGPSVFDQTHRLAFEYSWELPFFRRQHGALAKTLGGWEISGANIYSTGTPFTVFAGYDVNADGVWGDRPDIVDTAVLNHTVNQPYLDAATGLQMAQASQLPALAFTPNNTLSRGDLMFRPGLGNGGDLGRNTFRSDGQKHMDAALTKILPLADYGSLMFRCEAYNLTNTPQFYMPNNIVTSGSFGRISSVRSTRSDAQTDARYLQFALRYIF